jgi:hypothetical protein
VQPQSAPVTFVTDMASSSAGGSLIGFLMAQTKEPKPIRSSMKNVRVSKLTGKKELAPSWVRRSKMQTQSSCNKSIDFSKDKRERGADFLGTQNLFDRQTKTWRTPTLSGKYMGNSKHEIWKPKSNIGTTQWKKCTGDRFAKSYQVYQYNDADAQHTHTDTNHGSIESDQNWRTEDRMPELANKTTHDPVYSLSTAKSSKLRLFDNALKGRVEERGNMCRGQEQIDSCDKLIRDQNRKKKEIKGYVSFGKFEKKERGEWTREQGLPHEYPCQGRFAKDPDSKPTTNSKKAPFLSKSEPRLSSLSAHLARLPAFPQHRVTAAAVNPSNNARSNHAARPVKRPHPMNSQRYLD